LSGNVRAKVTLNLQATGIITDAIIKLDDQPVAIAISQQWLQLLVDGSEVGFVKADAVFEEAHAAPP